MALTHFYLNQVPWRKDYFKKSNDKKLGGAEYYCGVSDLVLINTNIV